MNISHVGNVDTNEDRLEFIFSRQRELIEKYEKIEAASGLLQTSDVPVNLDDRKGQARIKDFSWRVTEEIAEAMDAFYKDDLVHYKEELIDALHFLVELTILADVTPEEIAEDCHALGDKLYRVCNKVDTYPYTNVGLVCKVIENLGMMCNCLKNKPWKQSMMLTDREEFHSKLLNTWYYFMGMLYRVMGDEEIFQTYFKKNEVNKFRQRSNY